MTYGILGMTLCDETITVTHSRQARKCVFYFNSPGVVLRSHAAAARVVKFPEI